MPFDNPQAYIAGDRRRALALGVTMADRVHGAALFADISGFTALTESLVHQLGPQRGAEELTAVLSTVFDAVLVELHLHGGSVIYFSGDAVTCWLDDDDGLLATQCALAMQAAMDRVGVITLPSGAPVALGMKVAIAVGPARRFVVGDPDVQLIDVLAGALMDRLAAAEHAARQGEVVLDSTALEAVARRVDVAERRRGGEPGSAYDIGVVTAVTDPRTLPPPPVEALELPADVVRQWLLPAVYERLRTGRGEFLGELRVAVPLFLRFGGIDYDDDPDAAAKLDAFVVQAQRVIDAVGGNALQLTIGDKGAYLYAVFGSPQAHEDDGARACAAALELRDLERRTAATGIQIGIAQGRLRSGTYGHATRRTFCCLGDAVNLAARLMSAAPAGEIYVSGDVHDAAADRYDWAALPDLRVKGKSAAVPVHALRSAHRRTPAEHRRPTSRMVGRTRELATIATLLDRAVGSQGQVVGVTAEAGMGKSRLLAEASRLLGERGVPVHEGEAQAFGTRTGYLPWHDVLATLFELPVGCKVDEQQAHLERFVAALDPELALRVPLLGAVLGLPLRENDLTAALDPKLRKSSLEALLVQCLTHLAHRRPLALLLEDCHWLDPLSLDLLDVVARAIDRLPVLLLLAYRPPEEHDPLRALARLRHVTCIELDELDDGESRLLATRRLAEAFRRAAEPSEALVDVIVARAEGNPFYVEELVSFLRGSGIAADDEQALADVELPASLHSLVLSRIDTLPEAPRRTLKVSSVVGRVFREAIVRGSYPELGTEREVRGHLASLQHLDLVLLESEQDRAYLFRHVVTREVAYDSLPFAMRALLHGRVAAYLEANTDTEQSLDLLAHHWSQTDDTDKTRHYLLRAGDAAQAAYANAVALDYFRRAAPLVSDEDRPGLLLKLGNVLELVGEWVEAEQVYVEALDLAGSHDDTTVVARAQTAVAEVARKQGRYDDAAQALDTAGQLFAALDDATGEGRVRHLAGTLAAQQGAYDDARTHYEASLAIRRRLDDRASMAALLSNLGVIAEYGGDYAEAERLNLQALQIRTDLGDRWAVGVSQNNLGMIALLQEDAATARERFEESMRLNREVGDLWMVAIGHNNLGNVLRDQGDIDGARAHYADALRSYGLFDDRWAIAILYEDLAGLAAVAGAAQDALRLVGAADRVRADLGSPRAPAQDVELAGRLVPARDAAGTHSDALIAQGRVMSPTEAAEVASRVCSSTGGYG